jgi:hypothetical protein
MVANWDSMSCYGQPPGEYRTQGLRRDGDRLKAWLPKSIFMEWSHRLLYTSGWKIHISVDPADADRLARLALPKLRGIQVHHKVIGPWVDYERFNRDSNQRGKFITVYPGPSHGAAQQVLDVLDAACREHGFKPGPLPSVRKTGFATHEIPIGESGMFSCLWSDDYES